MEEMVTPCVGVWIETIHIKDSVYVKESHPAWVCGLKLLLNSNSNHTACHTLRGCVD